MAWNMALLGIEQSAHVSGMEGWAWTEHGNNRVCAGCGRA